MRMLISEWGYELRDERIDWGIWRWIELRSELGNMDMNEGIGLAIEDDKVLIKELILYEESYFEKIKYDLRNELREWYIRMNI